MWAGNAGAVGELWSYQQLAHSRAQVFFKCHLFRKSAMDQRLIRSALTSAKFLHASATGDYGTYTGSFERIPSNSQVSLSCSDCLSGRNFASIWGICNFALYAKKGECGTPWVSRGYLSSTPIYADLRRTPVTGCLLDHIYVLGICRSTCRAPAHILSILMPLDIESQMKPKCVR